MLMNVLIIAVWVIAIGIFGFGFFIKEKIEEKKRLKAREERLWLI